MEQKLQALDLKGKVLVVTGDDISEEMIQALRKPVKEAGGLGVIGIDSDYTLQADDLDTLEKMIKEKRAELESANGNPNS